MARAIGLANTPDALRLSAKADTPYAKPLSQNAIRGFLIFFVTRCCSRNARCGARNACVPAH